MGIQEENIYKYFLCVHWGYFGWGRSHRRFWDNKRDNISRSQNFQTHKWKNYETHMHKHTCSRRLMTAWKEGYCLSLDYVTEVHVSWFQLLVGWGRVCWRRWSLKMDLDVFILTPVFLCSASWLQILCDWLHLPGNKISRPWWNRVVNHNKPLIHLILVRHLLSKRKKKNKMSRNSLYLFPGSSYSGPS